MFKPSLCFHVFFFFFSLLHLHFFNNCCPRFACRYLDQFHSIPAIYHQHRYQVTLSTKPMERNRQVFSTTSISFLPLFFLDEVLFFLFLVPSSTSFSCFPWLINWKSKIDFDFNNKKPSVIPQMGYMRRWGCWVCSLSPT